MGDNGPTRPAFMFFGGKWRLASWIIGHLPPHVVYVEPFGGAVSVLLRKPPSKLEVFNDLNHEVFNFFKVLREPELMERLLESLRLTPYSREEFYLAWADAPREPVAMARAFFIKTNMSVGGAGSRSRKTGFCNHKYPDDVRDYPSVWFARVDNLLPVAERLKKAVIENMDASGIIGKYDHEEALFYCDPPYVHSTRSKNLAEYSEFEMSDDDHAGLAGRLGEIKGMAMVSGYRCGLYDRLYAGWKRLDSPAVGSFGARRLESLWLSPRAAAVRPRLF